MKKDRSDTDRTKRHRKRWSDRDQGQDWKVKRWPKPEVLKILKLAIYGFLILSAVSDWLLSGSILPTRLVCVWG